MDENKQSKRKKWKGTLLVIVGIFVIVFLGISGYSFIKKGKYLSSVEFELLSFKDELTLIGCLGMRIIGPELHKDFQNIVINTNDEYQAFINKAKNGLSESCQRIVFPDIDFSTKTLIGTDGSAWCRARLERDLRQNNRKKIYRYIVEEKLNCTPIIGCAARDCVSLHSLNLATMPKIEEGYDIQFEFYPVKFR